MINKIPQTEILYICMFPRNQMCFSQRLNIFIWVKKCGNSERLQMFQISISKSVLSWVYLADKKISILSGGEKSRVMLGKILLKPVNMLFLDEPTNHLDMESTEALMNAVYEFSGSVLMVSHDEYFLNKIADKLIIYDNGKVFNFNGTYKEFCKNIGWKDL